MATQNYLATLTGGPITVLLESGKSEALISIPSAATGGVQSVTAIVEDPGITVDNTDPANPVLFNSGVHEVVAGTGISVDNFSTPHHPIVSVTALGGTGARANKNMVASVTTADGQVACATTVAQTPTTASTAGGYVGVNVNGIAYPVGDGSKAGVACYFSGNGGTTARAMQAIIAGDSLYWQGSIAGFQLAVTDRLDFLYLVST